MLGFTYAIGKYTFLKQNFELGDWFSSIQLGFPSIHCWFPSIRVTFPSIRLEKDTIPPEKDTPIARVEFERLVPLALFLMPS